jgi:hypothetical protein
MPVLFASAQTARDSAPYRQRMTIPFSVEQFHGVFSDYNNAVWPAQVVLVLLALAVVVLVLRPQPWSGVAVSAVLAFFWAWIAAAYHFAFFTRINPLAYVFAAVSMAGAAVFVWQGVIQRRLRFEWVAGWRSAAGAALIVFALLVYPVWSAMAGHNYPATATFGLPCPTTLFTIGVLAFAQRPSTRSALVVPVLWCFVGAQAAFLLSVPPDLGLIAAAAVGVGLFFTARQRRA